MSSATKLTKAQERLALAFQHGAVWMQEGTGIYVNGVERRKTQEELNKAAIDFARRTSEAKPDA